MAPRALVTGGAGFVGQWLLRALLARGYAVTSVSQAAMPEREIFDPGTLAGVRWVADDIRRGTLLGTVIAEERPALIVHLAAVSHVPAAQQAPVDAWEVNVLGCVRLLSHVQAARGRRGYDPSILVVGSAEQYGPHGDAAAPLTEDAAQRPLTVYAATKAAQEVAALQAARRDGLRVIATRSFNHSGPGQPERFLVPSLVGRALALPSQGGRLPIGNDFVTRDFLHVEDVIEAYLLLAERGRPGEAYNVASGHGITVRQLAERALLRLGIDAEIVTDPTLVRPVDVPVLVGSPAKLQAATGWTPRRTVDTILDDLIRSAGTRHATP